MSRPSSRPKSPSQAGADPQKSGGPKATQRSLQVPPEPPPSSQPPTLRKETPFFGTSALPIAAAMRPPAPEVPAVSVTPTVQVGGRAPQPPKSATPPPTGKGNRSTAKFRPAINADSWGGAPPADEAPRPSDGLISDLDAALRDVDTRFDELISGDDRLAPASERPADLKDMREIFAHIAAGHMRPVRDFMIELQWGEPPRDWIGICRPSIGMLRKACEQVKIVGLAFALDDFADELNRIEKTGERTISGAGKATLLERYGTLVDLLPQTFTLSEARNQRETVIVDSLLKQVPDVGKVTIDKLYAAGLGSLEALFVAKADEVAVAAGIDLRLAERIVQRFRWYKSEIESIKPDEKHSPERVRLAKLLGDLSEAHLDFMEVSEALPTDESTKRKRELRNARQALLSEIQVVLARMGAVELVREVERLPFEKKIEAIDRHLQQAEG
jgi:hypothetical protein